MFDHRTDANWQVAEVAAEVADFRAYGVEVAEYDELGLAKGKG
jgi:hypothetical protein